MGVTSCRSVFWTVYAFWQSPFAIRRLPVVRFVSVCTMWDIRVQRSYTFPLSFVRCARLLCCFIVGRHFHVPVWAGACVVMTHFSPTDEIGELLH